jgi:uncharacterized RDD family membrane protein YckC
VRVSNPESDPSREDAAADALRLPRPPEPSGYVLLATYGQRVGAFLVDIGIPGGVAVMILLAVLGTRDLALILGVYGGATVLAMAFMLWNSGYLQGRTGQSLGKRLLGIRLVSRCNCRPVGFGRAVVRQFAHLLDGMPLLLGYLWPLWDEHRQTFADKLCGTLVVQVQV